jgi:hypothetical protein
MAKKVRPHKNLSNCNGGHGCGGEDCTCPCHFEMVDGDDEEGGEETAKVELVYHSTIAIEALPRLEQLVAEHNRRVAKLARRHHIEIVMATLRTVRTYQKEQAEEVSRWFADVEVTGQRAVIAGWEIVGSLTSTDQGYLATGIRSSLKAELLEPFKARGGQCDHCKAARTRSVTYLLRQGEILKLVGSTCLKDFTGHLSPSSWAAYADALVGLEAELEDLEESALGPVGHRAGESSAVAVVAFLAFVRAEMRVNGWVSKKKSNETGVPATATRAWAAMVALREVDRLADTDVPDRDPVSGDLNPEWQRAKDAVKPEATDVKQAEEDLEMVTERFSALAERGDYEDHLLAAINQGYAFGKNVGIVASICVAADNIRREAAKKAARDAQLDEWLGTEKKREVFELRCVYTQEIEGAYGTSYLHVFLDLQGRKATWFVSNDRLEKGSYKIKATVKKHEVYQGKKTTQLSRCVVVEKVGEEAQQSLVLAQGTA